MPTFFDDNGSPIQPVGGSQPDTGTPGAVPPLALATIKQARLAGVSDAAIQGLLASGAGEGLGSDNDPWRPGDSGTSFGPWQLHAGGGRYDQYKAEGNPDGSFSHQLAFVLNTMEREAPGFSKLNDPVAAVQQMHDIFRDNGASPSLLPRAQAWMAQVPQDTSGAGATPTAPATKPGVDYGSLLNKIAPGSVPQGPGSEPAGPPPTKQTVDYARMLNRITTGEPTTQVQNRYDTNPAVGPSNSWSAVGHFFAKAPQSILHGLIGTLGQPQEVGNSISDFFKGDRTIANSLALAGSAMFPGAAIEGAALGLAKKAGIVGQDTAIPGTSQDIKTLTGKIGLNTNLPEEEGDISTSGHLAGTFGDVIGGTLPFMGPGIAKKLGEEGLKAAGKYALKEAGLVTVTQGLGREVGEDLAPPEQKQAAGAVGQAAGPLGIIGAVKGIPAALMGARALMGAGATAGLRSGNGWFTQYVKGFMSPQNTISSMVDNPEAAAQNLQGLGAVKEGLPGGFQVPAATATMDQPLQAYAQNIWQHNDIANGQYRAMLNENARSLQGLADPPSLTEARTQLTEQAVRGAIQQADTDFAAATKGVTGQTPEQSVALKQAYEGNLRQNILSVMDERQQLTDMEFENARRGGLDNATVPTTRLYDKLSDLISQHIQSGTQDSHFPWSTVQTLYDRPVRGLFGVDGMPDTSQGLLSEHQLGASVPWGRVFGVYNEANNQLRSLARIGGDPQRMNYLGQIRDEALVTLRDMRMGGGQFAPGQVPASLQNAINSANEAKDIFENGPIGDFLGYNKRGVAVPDAAGSIKTFLAQSPGMQGNMERLFDGIQQASGRNPADAVKENIDKYLRQDFYDTYRNGGTAAAQKWMANMQPVWGSNQFQDLHQEFDSAIASKSVAESLVPNPQKELGALNAERANLYLGGYAGRQLDTVLSGATTNKYMATQDLFDKYLKLDPTGRAIEGFGGMAFDRLLAASSAPQMAADAGVDSLFSGRKAVAFYQQNKGMFDAINANVPGYSQRLQQFLNGAQMLDRITATPGIPIDKKLADFSVTGMGQIVARIAGAEIGRKMGTGTIQVPGIMSQFAQQIYSKFTKDMPRERAADILRDALMDPDKFQGLMQPITTPEAATRTSALLEPYVLSAPSNVANQVQEQQDAEKRGGNGPPKR